MKEAEKIHGGKITLTLSSPGADTFSRQSGEYFKRTMAKIGLGIKVEYSDWPTFQHKFRTKSAQFFVMGSTASSPDGQDFLGGFYGPYESPGPNSFNYCNPKFDELYRKSEVMFEGPERTKVYREMERIVADDCPGIFVYHSLGYVPYYKYLKNYKPNAFAYGLTKYHNIDLERRKKLVGR